MFVDFFVKRPFFSTVCSLLIILAGAVAIPSLPIAQFPILGAAAGFREQLLYQARAHRPSKSAVTTPLEQQINGVEGMKYMTSSSGNDGSCSITVTFDLTRDLDLAAVDVQNRVNTAQGRLPNEVKTNGISMTKASNNFVLAPGCFADHGHYDAALSQQLHRRLCEGRAEARARCGRRRHLRRAQILDAALARSRCGSPAAALRAGDVVNALREQNVQVAAGQVGQPPAKPGQTYQISVRAIGRLSRGRRSSTTSS